MNEFEQRMQEAAKEIRQTTRTLPRPGVSPPGRSAMGGRRGLLVFAAAFVAVILAFAVLPLLGGGVERTPAGPPDPTAPLAPPSTTVSEVTCSASDSPPLENQDLPMAVAEKRAAIFAAATSCDYQLLEELAVPGFPTDFGGGGVERFAQWEADGEGRLGTLLRILDMSGAEIVYGDGTRDFVWPAAFAYDRWDEIPKAFLDELSSVYTDEELDQLSGFGSYAGWRTGIHEDGAWRFFVAGD